MCPQEGNPDIIELLLIKEFERPKLSRKIIGNSAKAENDKANIMMTQTILMSKNE